MAAPSFDRDKAIRVLIDAQAMGAEEACQLHGVTLRTLKRYRKRLAGAPELSRAVTQKKEEEKEEWEKALERFLVASFDTMTQLLPQATIKDLTKIAGAVAKAGELKVFYASAKDDEPSGSREEGSPPEEGEGEAEGSSEDSVH
jgi:hypothetical protein